ncbi:M56 family metallopeptidase [Streptomyces fildesensis]|uniref:M56 family metallopeptidase n=1 Tax=Streptomyces fildesensis TaxID=375757 RepID=UPI0018DF0982|nr:M56 family metallopeptidase [Streptomyces fildesensis]
MSAALILFAYAGLLAFAAPGLLSRGGWTARAPRLGIIAWQMAAFSLLVSAALIGFALVVPTVQVSADLANLFRACVMALRDQYATPGGAAAAAVGAVLALAVLARAAWCVTVSLAGALHGRARHRDVLTLVGVPAAHLGAVVVDSDEPAVHCLPGRRRRIVVTTGALRLLDDRQLAAALAHERAHLDQRHDLVLAWSGGLARAFPRVRLFTRAHAETVRLVELLADDVAARSADRLTLAEALLTLAGSRTPAAALGAGGSTAAERVRRLITPYPPLGHLRTALTSTGVAALLALPLLGLATPMAAAAHLHYCPPGTVAAAPTAR